MRVVLEDRRRPDNLDGCGLIRPSDHYFMPQLAATGSGTIGSVFYIFRQDFGSGAFLMNVYLSASYDDAASFPHIRRVTKNGCPPWPAPS